MFHRCGGAFRLPGGSRGLRRTPSSSGAVEPLSGTFKDIGERYLEGVQYAAKTLNESGGLLGKKVEVIPIDSELKPDVATRKAQNLILKDGVKFFCGGTGSSVGRRHVPAGGKTERDHVHLRDGCREHDGTRNATRISSGLAATRTSSLSRWPS